MFEWILLVLGAALLGVGAVALVSWAGDRSGWFDLRIWPRQSSARKGMIPMWFYFFSVVVAPLLVGGTLVVYALRKML
jgi:tetrahydromethanopterin S-methyltransferase subunit D